MKGWMRMVLSLREGAAKGWIRMVLALVLFGMLANFWLGGSFYLIDRWQPVNTSSLGPINEGHEFAQEVTVPAKGLARVDLHLDNNSPGADAPIRFEVLWYDPMTDDWVIACKTVEPIEEEVASADFNSFEMHRFEFFPRCFDHISGQKVRIRVSSPDEGPDGLTIRASDKDIYPQGDFFIDGEERSADLNFALYHETGIEGLAEKEDAFRPLLLGQKWFFISCMVVAVFAFVLVLFLMDSEELSVRQPDAECGDPGA